MIQVEKHFNTISLVMHQVGNLLAQHSFMIKENMSQIENLCFIEIFIEDSLPTEKGLETHFKFVEGYAIS